MAFPIASDPGRLMRHSGTGRVYLGPVAGTGLVDLGEATFSLAVKSDQEEVKGVRSAAKATVLTVDKERSGTLKITCRELTVDVLRLGLYGSAPSAGTQAAASLEAVAVTPAEGEGADLGRYDLSILRLSHAAPTGGAFAVGDAVTGVTSAATGEVAWKGAGYLELINVTGSFAAGETLGNGTATAACTAVETLADAVVTDSAAAPTKRYVAGTDYRLDAQYGLIFRLPGGTMTATAYVSANVPARATRTLHGLASAAQERRVRVVTDADDTGPRYDIVVHRAKLAPAGDLELIGSGKLLEVVLDGTIQMDTGQPQGQEFFSVREIGAA